MLSERVRRLREQSITTRPYISAERAELLTDFYMNEPGIQSVPVTRALAFKYILENKAIYLGDGELIVGERGPAPKATPTYPELCCHTLEDLEVLSSREKTPFHVSEDVKRVFREKIIPFWNQKTMRERVFCAVSAQWKRAFDAGVFTEFMEQRAPGHAILDDKIYHKGLLALEEEIEDALRNLDYYNDDDAYWKEQELRAMVITLHALIEFAERYAREARRLAETEKNPQRKSELEMIGKVCSHVPALAPRTFWEALQMYWFVHVGVITELNVWDSFNPGRLDQHLYPFYKEDLETTVMTENFAKELLQCFWIKINNQPAPPKVEITEEQSGTYQDFSLINVGGITEDGVDAVNELSYVILDVIDEMRLIQPSTCIQLSAKNDQRFLRRALHIVKSGFGQPSIFNADVIQQEFLRMGKSVEDARAGGPSGCVTISAFGKESCILTGYMNWPKILEITLNDGIDPITGDLVGIRSGDPTQFTSFEQIMKAFRNQLKYFVDLKIKYNNIIERLYAKWMPAPFLSLLIDDCIQKGGDYHDGGPRYNSTYIQGVGMGTVTDSFAAIRYCVFDENSMTMQELLHSLARNFEECTRARQSLVDAPKYGNDEDYADSIARDVFDMYFDLVDGRPNTKGGEYRINLLPTTVHIYFGQTTGATPNGRRRGEPLSDGISPSQGADLNGPTAVIKSASKIDHVRTGGTLLNQKFLPHVLQSTAGIEKLAHLIRTYFALGGHHIQFNVVDAETLRKAQQNPEMYRDLIVRVAGYSDYFVDIGKELQDEIISRTAHGVV
ncbi:MAG: glycyl radical protein [Theionarchaea archaeon]|nr:glycyl radical protein [Theionarchaea archaeon]MBU7036370.1 glycyl radical protein [Theionarchaea archaeon]